MGVSSNAEGSSAESRIERSELDYACSLFVEKFRYFNKHRSRFKSKLPEDKETSKIILLLGKVEKLQDHFQEAVGKNPDFKHINLPFITSKSEDGESYEDSLVIEVIPCGAGKFIKINKAFEEMKEMVHMIALLKNLRKQYFQSIYELLKFLCLHIEKQAFADKGDAEPLSFDAREAAQLLDFVSFRASQALIDKYYRRVDHNLVPRAGSKNRKVGQHSGIPRDVNKVEQALKTQLRQEIEEYDEISAVQADVSGGVDENCEE